MSASSIQAAVSRGYAIAATKLGTSFVQYRSPGSNPLRSVPLATIPAVFTNAKSSGFNFDKSSTFEDVLFAVLIGGVQIGDYLVGSSGTFFIADMPPLRPVVAVQCNRIVTITRPNSERNVAGGQAQGLPSQPGGTGRYRGVSTAIVTSGAGESDIVIGIPCAMIGSTGRATGTGETPTDAPGPSRWRIYLPQSAAPKGTIHDRDIVTDEEGIRHQVSAAGWTSIGYRLETVRLEN